MDFVASAVPGRRNPGAAAEKTRSDKTRLVVTCASHSREDIYNRTSCAVLQIFRYPRETRNVSRRIQRVRVREREEERARAWLIIYLSHKQRRRPFCFYIQCRKRLSYLTENHRLFFQNCGERPSATFMRAPLTCQDWACGCGCGCCCWLGNGGCCWESGEEAGGVTGAQPFVCCCWKCEGWRRSVPPGLTGDGDDGTTLCVDDRATVEGGWGDGPDEGLLWYEPRSPPYPRVLPEENR